MIILQAAPTALQIIHNIESEPPTSIIFFSLYLFHAMSNYFLHISQISDPRPELASYHDSHVYYF